MIPLHDMLPLRSISHLLSPFCSLSPLSGTIFYVHPCLCISCILMRSRTPHTTTPCRSLAPFFPQSGSKKEKRDSVPHFLQMLSHLASLSLYRCSSFPCLFLSFLPDHFPTLSLLLLLSTFFPSSSFLCLLSSTHIYKPDNTHNSCRAPQEPSMIAMDRSSTYDGGDTNRLLRPKPSREANIISSAPASILPSLSSHHHLPGSPSEDPHGGIPLSESSVVPLKRSETWAWYFQNAT
ncbi:hypothetical protein B0O80DRAFT_126961 [Mortierella sp. GBAus27b]|nr:hypothetical protein B0O80DRAFT_126961 [Mortierella sp. GBAus27b]